MSAVTNPYDLAQEQLHESAQLNVAGVYLAGDETFADVASFGIL